MGFYYQLEKDKLLDLFFVYKQDYLPTLEKVARRGHPRRHDEGAAGVAANAGETTGRTAECRERM